MRVAAYYDDAEADVGAAFASGHASGRAGRPKLTFLRRFRHRRVERSNAILFWHLLGGLASRCWLRLLHFHFSLRHEGFSSRLSRRHVAIIFV